MIDSYFNSIEQVIDGFDIIERSEIKKQKINNSFGIIEGILVFKNGILDFLEVVRLFDNHDISKKKYKYHFRRFDNSMVFRYDNIPHYPKISTFPHHKHEKNIIIESEEPELIWVLKEIKTYITNE